MLFYVVRIDVVIGKWLPNDCTQFIFLFDQLIIAQIHVLNGAKYIINLGNIFKDMQNNTDFNFIVLNER